MPDLSKGLRDATGSERPKVARATEPPQGGVTMSPPPAFSEPRYFDRRRGAQEVMCSMRSLLGAMARHRTKAGTLAPALERFLKVTRSYWPGSPQFERAMPRLRIDSRGQNQAAASRLRAETCVA